MPTTTPIRALLSARELEIVERARRGIASKTIAIDLRLSVSAVSHTLSRVAARFGVPSRVALIARLSSHGTFDDPRLTPAELANARLAIEGYSNAEIARIRGVAPRTVANQLAAAYQKLGVGSRAGLAASSAGSGWIDPEALEQAS